MGIRKGFNKFITQIFVVNKDNEIQIGCPTEVKHVAHIGFDAAPGASPSWMGKFESGPNFALSSIGASGSSLQPISSRELQSNKGKQQSKTSSDVVGKEASSTEVVPPKHRKLRRKKKKSETTSSTRHDDGNVKTKRRSKLIEGNVNNQNIKVL